MSIRITVFKSIHVCDIGEIPSDEFDEICLSRNPPRMETAVFSLSVTPGTALNMIVHRLYRGSIEYEPGEHIRTIVFRYLNAGRRMVIVSFDKTLDDATIVKIMASGD